MTFLEPAAGFLALTLPAIVALYFLRIRRPTRVVPALHLWPDQIRDRQANVPWQRLRFSWLLLLQLLVAALLVAGAVQPALSASVTLAPHTIVLVDASASMQARDVQPSRLDEAKREIGELIDQLGPQDRMTLIVVQASPHIAASISGDHGALHAALSAVAASNGAADLSAALALAAGIVRPGEAARAELFSDGISEPLSSGFASGLPFPVDYHRIGTSGENVGLTSLVVRAGPQGPAAYLRAQNFGQQARSFTLDWRADGGLIDVRPIKLAGGQAVDLVLPVPAGATTLTARVNDGDLFALDDTASAVARAPRTFRVLLVSTGNVFLEQALKLRTDFQVDVVAPSAYRDSTAYAVSVFDRFAPKSLPGGPFVMVDPPPGSALAGGPALGIGRVRASDAGDPLLTNVSLQDVHVARSQDLTGSNFGRTLITSSQTPLVLVRDEPYREALFGFDIHESDFPLRVGFPILIENLTEWMLPATVPARSFHPDEPVTIVPQQGASSVTVLRPDGSRRVIPTGAVETFADTDLTGIYTVEQIVSGRVDRSWFAVNLFSDSISQIRPVAQLTLPPTLPLSPSAHLSHAGQIPLWPWIALFALVVVLAEWFAFHRGI